MLSQQTAVINNDALLIAISAVLSWMFFRALRVGPSLRFAAAIGGVVGLAFMAKPHGLFLGLAIPVLAVTYAFAGSSLRSAAAWTAAAVIAAGLMLVVWAIVSFGLHGSVLPHGVAAPAALTAHGMRQWLAVYADRGFNHVYWLFVISAWGDMSWLSAVFPVWVYAAIGALLIILLAGVIAGTVRGRLDRWMIVPTSAVVVGAVLVLLLLEAMLYRIGGQLVLQGRDFLEVLPLLCVLLIGGACAWVPRRSEATVCGVVVIAALALNVGAVMVLLGQFFS
jgi:hypothetical protein